MRRGQLANVLWLGVVGVALGGLLSATEAPAAAPLDCETFDVVFLVDTSGSIQDEGTVLCNNIQAITAGLLALGLDTRATLLGIMENPPGSSFGCLTDNVPNLLGTAVPGSPPACCPTLNTNEDWAAATAIVADGFAWEDWHLRVIIPISDEGPEDGDPCQDPGLDRASITNAINVAIANSVIVAPITGNGSSACVKALAADLAAGTGGSAFTSVDQPGDLVTAINTILMDLCQSGPGIIPGPLDFCPTDVDKVDPGACGCGMPDGDADGDVVPDCVDNCLGISNPDQADLNANGIGDACEEDVEPEITEGATGCGAGSCGAGVVGAGLLGLWSLCGAKLARRRRRTAPR